MTFLTTSDAFSDDYDKIVIPDALTSIVEKVDVAAAGSGIVTAVNIKEGNVVKQGDYLVQIDDTATKLKSNQAATSLLEAKQKFANDLALQLARKTFDVAKADYDRAVRINRGIPNSVAASEMAILKLTVDKTQLEIEQAKHIQSLLKLGIDQREVEAKLADHEFDLCSIRSPIDGMVLNVETNVGEWVKAGDLLTRVVRIDRVRVEGFVDISVAGQHLLNAAATMEFAARGRLNSVHGSVVFVSPEADPVTNVVRIWTEFDNNNLQLIPGMRGTLTIRRAADSNAPSPSPAQPNSDGEGRGRAGKFSSAARLTPPSIEPTTQPVIDADSKIVEDLLRASNRRNNSNGRSHK